MTVHAIRRTVAGGLALLLAFGAWWELRPRQHPHHYSVVLSNASELVTRNAVRQPQASATSCETRNDNPTPNEKLDV